jgi:hypothetical protein
MKKAKKIIDVAEIAHDVGEKGREVLWDVDRAFSKALFNIARLLEEAEAKIGPNCEALSRGLRAARCACDSAHRFRLDVPGGGNLGLDALEGLVNDLERFEVGTKIKVPEYIVGRMNEGTRKVRRQTLD